MCEQATVADILREAISLLSGAGVDTPRLDAQLLLAWAIGGSREDLIREPIRVLSPAELASFQEALSQRARRRPLAHILGKCWFYGREVIVDPNVLIPRPETEMLVDWLRESAPESARVADIGTGSGCIAVCAALARCDIAVTGVDLSQAALDVARANIDRWDLSKRVVLAHGDLFAPLAGQQFEIVVSNPPYIPRSDMTGLMPEVQQFEPPIALYEHSGPDGLDYYRRLFSEAPQVLLHAGWIAVEVGAGQALVIAQIARSAGYNSIETRRDGAGIERVVIAEWP